jgi:hypothetical protein
MWKFLEICDQRYARGNCTICIKQNNRPLTSDKQGYAVPTVSTIGLYFQEPAGKYR